jgi:hypothetical protein
MSRSHLMFPELMDDEERFQALVEIGEDAERDRMVRAMDPRRRGLAIDLDARVLSSRGGYGASWSQTSSADVTGLRLGGCDVLVSFEPEAGQSVHLLWCLHSAGDSEGSSSGNFAALAAFLDRGAAELARAALAMHARMNERRGAPGTLDTDRAAVLDDFGRPMFVQTPWGDYFCDLESLRLDTFVVQPDADA